jgi:hypothetical protein
MGKALSIMTLRTKGAARRATVLALSRTTTARMLKRCGIPILNG